MDYYDKKKSFQKLAEEILEDGGEFTIRKNNGKVIFESDSQEVMERSYKTRAILNKYNEGYLRFYGLISALAALILLPIVFEIHASKPEYDYWVVYLGLLILYILTMNRIRKTLHYVYIRLNWKKLRFALQEIAVDDYYLLNEYGDNSEFEEMIVNIADRFHSERNRRSNDNDFR